MIKSFLKIIALFFFTAIHANGQIVINEFMSDNATTLSDQDGEYHDWIEIYNNSNVAINLLNYSLSDKNDELNKWLFPSITIAPHSFIVVFASGKNILNPNELHTNFKISSDGESLFLSNNAAQLIDQMEPINLSEDKSYGRSPDGSDNFLPFIFSTPNSSNNLNNKLTFEFNNGFYTHPFYQKISSLTGDTIYFSLDGSPPTTDSEIFPDSLIMDYKYSTPNVLSNIPTTTGQWEAPHEIIDKANILRCASYKNGIRTSEIYTHTYIVDSTIFEKYDMPIISLITDADHLFDEENGIYVPGVNHDLSDPGWTGNYFERGDLWEKPVHIEYFEKDGNLGFSQNAGIQIHGEKTRFEAQKSFKFYARNDYGKKYFNYPLMPNRQHDKYKRFILKTTMGSWQDAIINDVLAHEITKGLDFNFQDYSPVIVFINGEYWGIQTIQDRIDERYIAYSNDLDPDSVEFRGFYNFPFLYLMQYIEANDMADNMVYDSVKTKIDIDNVIDYHIAEMFIKNFDWPANNLELWKEKNEDGKWRFIFYDLDAGFGDYNYNMFEHMAEVDTNITWPNSPSSTFLYRNLMKNEDFKNQFINRYAELLNNNFQKDTLIRKANQIIKLYESEMPRHISRWNYHESVSEWKNLVDKNIIAFIENRPCVVNQNLLDFFNLTAFDFNCLNHTIEASTDDFLLAPNPNDGNFFICNNSLEKITGDILITDIIGQQVYFENNVSLETREKKLFSFSNLPNNTYLLIFQNKTDRKVKKFSIRE